MVLVVASILRSSQVQGGTAGVHTEIHTLESPAARPSIVPPTSMVACTAFVSGSIRTSRPPPRTHTAPSPTATPVAGTPLLGDVGGKTPSFSNPRSAGIPVSMDATTWFDWGSILVSVPPMLITHTELSSAAAPLGWGTGIDAT